MKLLTSCLTVSKVQRFNKCPTIRFYSTNLNAADEETASSLKFSPVPNAHHQLYSFGLTQHGALGLKKEGNRLKKYLHKPIRHFFAEENCVTDVCSGYGFSAIAVNSQDTFKVYGCGINTDKQICADDLDIVHCPYPINIGLQSAESKVISLSAGRAHLAVTTDKEGTFILGSNCYGQCARYINEKEKYDQAFVVNCIKQLDEAEIVQVCCGQDHTLFLTCNGDVYSCGWGADGQTGLDTTSNVCIPSKVGGDICGQNIICLAGVSDTVLALNDEGEVFGWGSNEFLQLSPSKEIEQRNCPSHLKHLSDFGKIIDIAAGGSFCMILTEDGNVYVWGYGILGAGPQVQRTNIPMLLPRTLFGCNELAPDTTVVKISCGLTYMVAINSCSHMYTWGHNKHGCLGIGHIRDQYFPYKVALGALAVKASCGVDHTMVLGKPFG